jgi:hypothetical protein
MEEADSSRLPGVTERLCVVVGLVFEFLQVHLSDCHRFFLIPDSSAIIPLVK